MISRGLSLVCQIPLLEVEATEREYCEVFEGMDCFSHLLHSLRLVLVGAGDSSLAYLRSSRELSSDLSCRSSIRS